MNTQSSSPLFRIFIKLSLLLFANYGAVVATASNSTVKASASNISNSSLDRLAPVKVGTPRETMRTFLTSMEKYRELVKTTRARADEYLSRAIRCFDLSDTNFVLRKEVGKESAIFLKEVIDRAIVIDYQKIPDDSDIESWRLKGTEITIAKSSDPDRKGEYLFSKDTTYRAKEFFEKVRHLPFIEGGGKGAAYSPPWYESKMPDWAQKEFFLIANWQWAAIFLVILLGLILNKVVVFLIDFLTKTILKNRLYWQRQSLLAIEKPAGTIVASGFWFLSIYAMRFEGRILSILTVLVQIILSLAIIRAFYLLTNVMSEFLKAWTDKTESTLDDEFVPLITKSARIFVIVFGILVTFQNLGFNVMSVLAGLGLGGLAFALAAKDTCANFFGSIMILLDRPFGVGDWIVTGGAEGTVEEIGFRSTRIRTFYNSVVSVPNSQLANQNIDNMGLREFRRVYKKIGVTYDTPVEKIEKFCEGIRQIILNNEFTRKDYFHVYFNDYNNSSLDIMLYFFLKVPDWTKELQEKEAIFLEVKKLAESMDVEFAFPTQTIHLAETPELPVRNVTTSH